MFLILVVLICLIYTLQAVQFFRYFNIRYSKVDWLEQLDNNYFKIPRVYSLNRVVVSLTTIPERVEYLHYTLKSLLTQSKRVDEIVLAIPYFTSRKRREYKVPDYLTRLKHIKILRCEDVGPLTKVLPVLEDEALDTKVIYLDDDRVYNTHVIEKLVEASEKYPNKAICNYGWRIPPDYNFITHCRNIVPTYLYGPSSVDVIEGCEGCLVKPKFFNLEELKNLVSGPPEAFFVDDIWISGHLAKQKVKKHRMPLMLNCKFFSMFLKTPTLSKDNSDGKNNNITIDYFREYWGNL